MQLRLIGGLLALCLAGLGNLANAAPSMGWLDANGTSLRYRIDGTGPPVVLIHEMGTSLEVWDEVVPKLTGHRVIRYDIRGFGLSEKLRGPIDFDTEVADLTALLDRLGVTGPVTLAGSALGGAIALRFAASHPERAAGVVAIGPAAYLTVRPEAVAQADVVERQPLGNRVRGEIDTIYPPQIRHDPDRQARFVGVQMAADVKSLAESMRMIGNTSFADVLPTIHCPTWIVATTLYKTRDPASLRELASRVPGGVYKELTTGHLAPIESPDLVAGVIQQFWKTQARPK